MPRRAYLVQRLLDARRRRLGAIVGGVVRVITRVVKREVVSAVLADARLNAPGDDPLAKLREVSEGLRRGLRDQRAGLERAVARIGSDVQRYQLRTMGEDLDMTREQVADTLSFPFAHLDVPEQSIDDWTRDNVNRITGLADDTLDEIHAVVRDGIRDGKRAQEIADEIADRGLVAQSRAELIAHDQVGKLYGQLNADRHQALGYTQFVWRTVHDQRVRKAHKELDGQVFDYATGAPGEGVPGEPIRCRCWADPVDPDLGPAR